MRKLGKVLAIAGAPVAMAGMLLGGAAGFTSAATQAVTLNRLSDTITFSGTLIVGGTHFAVNSTSCKVKDKDTGTTFPCHLGGAGSISGSTSTSDITVTGPDGTVTWHQTATSTGSTGCATGTGLEISDDHSGPVPVRVEGLSLSTPLSPTVIAVSGTVAVYEQGGVVVGLGCAPD